MVESGVTKISYLENYGERRTLGFQWSSHRKRPTNKIPNRTVFAFVCYGSARAWTLFHSQSIFEYENEGVQDLLNCIHYVVLAVHQ